MKFPKIILLVSQMEIIVKNNIYLIAILNHRLKKNIIYYKYTIYKPNKYTKYKFNFASTKFNDENIIMTI